MPRASREPAPARADAVFWSRSRTTGNTCRTMLSGFGWFVIFAGSQAKAAVASHTLPYGAPRGLGLIAQGVEQKASPRGEATGSQRAVSEATSVDLAARPRGRRLPSISGELGVGLLSLPVADVCVQRAIAGCRKGDRGLELNAWPFFRANQSWAFGAGLTLSLMPDTSAPRQDPPNIPREHTRQYFMFESAVRYFAWSSEDVELWLAPAIGLVVISDTFSSKQDIPDFAQVGASAGVNLATEGLTLGGGLGLSFALSRHWQLGTYLRAANWFLPDEPARTPTQDEASLTGNVFMLDMGITVGFTTPRY